MFPAFGDGITMDFPLGQTQSLYGCNAPILQIHGIEASTICGFGAKVWRSEKVTVYAQMIAN
jgi:hypothetical protein